MSEQLSIDSALSGKVVAVPEARQLDVFCGLLERRGATVLRAPLVAIKDAPDPRPVLQWIEAFNAGQCSELILLTGEGLIIALQLRMQEASPAVNPHDAQQHEHGNERCDDEFH